MKALRENNRITEPPKPLPAKVEPLMLAHLVFSGDLKQQNRWHERIERIQQQKAIDRTPDPALKSLLAQPSVWHQMRRTGKLGATLTMTAGAFWMAGLVSLYATAHGFGWLAASAYLLPIPIAWKVGRRLWERASLAGMASLGRKPSAARRLAHFLPSMFHSFFAGFGMAFTLVFLQGLISWFMTPAPTLLLELLFDVELALQLGVVGGVVTTALAPLVNQAIPERDAPGLLTDGEH